MKLAVVVAIASALCACKSNRGGGAGGAGASQSPGQKGTGARQDDTRPGPRPGGHVPGPIACKSDADCPPRSCGPCKPGQVIMRKAGAVACARNPCTNARSVCNAQHRCAVHPDTRFVEDVHSEECKKLLRDKWGILCKGKNGSALTACQNIIDAATARDDNGACKAARARVLK